MSPANYTLVRFLIISLVLLFVFLSQRYWFLGAWRIAGRAGRPWARHLLRAATVLLFALLVVAFFVNFSFRSQPVPWHSAVIAATSGLWFSTALFSYFAVELVTAMAWLWRIISRARVPEGSAEPARETVDIPRRRFVQAATIFAGAIPFAGAAYGFAFERFQYQVHEVDLPLAGLPQALNGLRIAQLSDIHIGSYMSAAEVRRAVDMTNELRADLTVVTGDFLTRAGDPLESCIAELSRLQAPLGVWGCNGNHEIYADVEARAAKLFARHGMFLLRQENAELVWHNQPFNLIGVDYQRERDPNGYPLVALRAIEPLVRRDVPNILLSHNPNSFRRAAELGIDLMLTGHTHGGQVRVEILDYRFSPAQFLTPYVAGIYRRPLGAASDLNDDEAWAAVPTGHAAAVVYVNRGLGTIGAPLRLGVPPEISLHTLRRA